MKTTADHDIKLPQGAVILEAAQPDPNAPPDLELALDLAAHGASERLVRSVGGDQAVLEAEAATGHHAA